MRNKGFTILEILVVLAVLSILIGIAVPRIKGMQDQGNIQKAKSELKTLQAAVEAYYINHSNVYPGAANTGYTTPCATYLNGESVKIVASPLYDPFGATSTTEYYYKKSADGMFYVIVSVGAQTADTNPSGVAVADSTGAVTKDNTGNICVTNGVSGC